MKLINTLIFLGLWTSIAYSSTSTADGFSTSLDFAQVVKVKAIEQANNTWCFHTQVRHNDQGWDHYADHWEVTNTEGQVLGERPLAHPHDNEQPFTRSQCGIKIPSQASTVIVKAKCNVHGYGGKPVVVDLTKTSGNDFSIEFR